MPEMERSGYNILEKDVNGDLLCTWTYPSCTQKQRDLLQRKCRFEGPDTAFIFGRFSDLWYYIHLPETTDTAKLPNVFKVRNFAICIWAKEFNPEKFEAVAKVMSKNYGNNGDHVEVMKIYLSVMTYGKYEGMVDSIRLENYSELQSPDTNIKELITNFGLETILIYTAVLLKKRVVVYHHNLSILLKTARSLPAFVKHRLTPESLFPCVDLHKDEIITLKSCMSYVAGCQDANVASTDLFDVFVHLPAREISIAAGAREAMAMTRTHKEIAFFLVQLAQNDSLSERQTVDAIASKTKDILDQLRSLATENNEGRLIVSREALRSKNLPQTMENFLLNLAAVEEMLP